MKAKTVFAVALAWTLYSFATVHAQTPGSKYSVETAPPPAMVAGPVQGAPGSHEQVHHLSSWITGEKYACCDCGLGGGPVQTEFFFRTGPSLVAGSGTIADVLQTGLYLGAGGRTLFFDPCMTSAWTVELSLSTVWNHAHSPTTYSGIPLNILVPQNPATPVTPPDATGQLPPQRVFFGKNGVPGVTLRELNRTFANVGGGREWYLWGAANCGGATCRIGFDAGGRWGSEMAQFNEIRHRTDVVGGPWVALHADYEVPCCGCCIFQAGCRIEYDYIWSDILQIQNKSDTQDVNILFSVGVRY